MSIHLSPKVSVIIAAYNAQDTLSTAVESALNQSGCEVEVVIVDDCSTDNTLTIANRYAAQYAQVKVFQNYENSGPSVARNLAIEESSGQWLAVLDADDRFAPDRLIKMHRCATQNGLDFVLDSYYLTTGHNTSPYATKLSGICANNTLKYIDAATFIKFGLGSAKPLFKKSLLNNSPLRFDSNVNSGEDLLFYAQLLFNLAKGGILNCPMYYRTESPYSLSRRNRVLFLSSLLSVFSQLEVNAKKAGVENSQLLQAIAYRKRVTQDALSAVRWKNWVTQNHIVSCPPFTSLAGMFRHLCFRKHRYAITNAI